MSRCWIFLLLLAGPAALAEAAPEKIEAVVVTANRVETPEEDVASSTTVITQEEIRSKQRDQVADLLRDVPGLAVMNSGGMGRATSVMVRGAGSDHTLVLIDGVPANDPLTSGFDFGNLSTEDVERIEIVRGSQSVLYGSSATGGVVNVITKRGEAGPPKSSVEAEYGTYDSYRIDGNVSGGSKQLSYYLGAGRSASDGFTAADKNVGNPLPEGQSLNTATVRITSEALPRTKLEAVARFSDARFNLATTSGVPNLDGEVPGEVGTDRELFTRISATTQVTAVWKPSLALTYGHDHRTSDHDNPSNPADSQSSFDSNRFQALFQNDLSLSEADTLTLGVESALEQGSSSETAELDSSIPSKQDLSVGAFAQDQWISDGFFATAGARYDAYRDLDSKATYRLAPGYHLGSTTLRGSLGTGFKEPSLYQRFSSYGNPLLQPETSVSWDAGVDQQLGKSVKVGAGYFHTNYENEIDFAGNRFMNVGKATTSGVEATGAFAPSSRLTLTSSYTFLIAQDDLSGLPLLRRPKHELTLGADERLTDRAQIGALARLVGARADIDAVSGARIEMPAYAVFYLTARYQVTRDLRLFGRIDNLFDRQYEEINGFATPGRSLFVGLAKEI